MNQPLRTAAALVSLLAVLASACAVASESSDPNARLPQVSAICAEEVPDCDDTVAIDPNAVPEDGTADEPGDAATPPGASGVLVGGGLTIPEALATDATGILAVQGFYLDDGTGPRLCETLAESFPPQCGGASLLLGDLTGIDLGLLQNSGSTTWSDQPVVILGELTDGTLNPTPTSI